MFLFSNLHQQIRQIIVIAKKIAPSSEEATFKLQHTNQYNKELNKFSEDLIFLSIGKSILAAISVVLLKNLRADHQ